MEAVLILLGIAAICLYIFIGFKIFEYKKIFGKRPPRDVLLFYFCFAPLLALPVYILIYGFPK